MKPTEIKTPKRLMIQRTVQDVDRPPFAEWYCEIKGVKGTSMFRVKLEAMLMLRSICPYEPLPTFLSEAVHDVKGHFIPAVKAITDSDKVAKIEFTYNSSALYVEIKFKEGQTIVISENLATLHKEVFRTTTERVFTGIEFEQLVKNRLLRRFFRRRDFMELI